MIICAVPVKDLANAKQRLVPALGAAERRDLARAMLRDVLAALAAARLDRVWVVTRDAEVIRIAAGAGAEALTSLTEAENSSHTAAVAFAQAEASRRGARVFLTIPGDVPCVTAAEIRELAAAARDGAPSLVPSRSGFGTNGVALVPPDAMPLTFGEPSFANHLAAARLQDSALGAHADLRALESPGEQKAAFAQLKRASAEVPEAQRRQAFLDAYRGLTDAVRAAYNEHLT